ncbi:MAG: nitroreductase family protein [Candidatus Thorarchaeota archaeon]
MEVELLLDVFEAIKGRRSVRAFLPDEVPQQDLELILDMARYAPTAANNQPWKFLVVRNGKNKVMLQAKIKEFVEKRIDDQALELEEKTKRKEDIFQYLENLFVVPVLVFLLVDGSQYPELVMCDGTLAAQNMMLAAHALGYGTCFQTTFFPEELVRDYFAIPDHYRLICTVPIGRAASQPEMPQKKPLASFILEEQFSD